MVNQANTSRRRLGVVEEGGDAGPDFGAVGPEHAAVVEHLELGTAAAARPAPRRSRRGGRRRPAGRSPGPGSVTAAQLRPRLQRELWRQLTQRRATDVADSRRACRSAHSRTSGRSRTPVGCSATSDAASPARSRCSTAPPRVCISSTAASVPRLVDRGRQHEDQAVERVRLRRRHDAAALRRPARRRGHGGRRTPPSPRGGPRPRAGIAPRRLRVAGRTVSAEVEEDPGAVHAGPERPGLVDRAGQPVGEDGHRRARAGDQALERTRQVPGSTASSVSRLGQPAAQYCFIERRIGRTSAR